MININIADEIETLKIKSKYVEKFDKNYNNRLPIYNDSEPIKVQLKEQACMLGDCSDASFERYLLNHIREVEQVIDYYGWTDVGGSLKGAVSMAQHDYYYEEMVHDLDAIILYGALCKLRDEGKKELTDYQFYKLQKRTRKVSVHSNFKTVINEAIAEALKDKEVITYSDWCDDDGLCYDWGDDDINEFDWCDDDDCDDDD